MRYLVKVAAALICLAGWYHWIDTSGEKRRTEASQSRQAIQDNLNDPDAAPILSQTMQNPDWTIGKWLAVGRKSSDCIMADEMMDKNATAKIVKRRGASKTYYLSDYIASCDSFSTRMYFEIVTPRAEKWCQFRKTTARLDTLCTEWTENKDRYWQNLQAAKQPTLERYRIFTGS